MIVKAVVPVDKRKCKVFLEGDFAFVLYKSEAARFHIEEGNDLPAKTYERIEEEILLKRARDRALYLLQSQGRTQAEMIKKLKKEGVVLMVCIPSSRQLKKYKIFVLPGWISGNIFMPPIVAFHEIPLVLRLQALSVAGRLYSNLYIL